ncbi:hypothetical protein Pla175_09940 [Pirellulimonas nuda]|uniref:DNA-(apurinic or apyrimidinic site) lyase n=1 Tax=Pirellulimonas nuda TaxID=2528009 RepID=A0A518D820_9BACT|nr:hypothetical protein [Pirellulimonas nuda]QDU87629.1 hypothetical protein Pla175_09940 [Pirellulimonas nuda]
MSSRLSLATPEGFAFNRAVCSYGYFLLAPNRWRPAEQALEHTAAPEGAGPTLLRVTQPKGAGAPLRIECATRLDRAQAGHVKQALRRMLRLDDDLSAWRRLHPKARRRGFGRLFRSASLFEDMVKTITGCNVTWRNTIVMNRLLAERFGAGAFPSPAQLARVAPERLKAEAKVGYRAERIIQLAQRFEEGSIEPGWFESPQHSTGQLREALLAIHGFGPYAAANMLQLLGRFDHVPIDTETYRHYCLQQGVERPADAAALDAQIRAHYDRYHPYQFLAYWFDLWRDYQRRFGNAWTWDPDTAAGNFTASVLNRTP